ncbi:unnamed protein product [Allacma fusca]|uniref:Uncharacterized protein n=1 Tax=Allacma fusca TaxID=39272 RepID=A0A8J2JHV6_9HEXA|nr:unnamed protein product [Allacma fusca]
MFCNISTYSLFVVFNFANAFSIEIAILDENPHKKLSPTFTQQNPLNGGQNLPGVLRNTSSLYVWESLFQCKAWDDLDYVIPRFIRRFEANDVRRGWSSQGKGS